MILPPPRDLYKEKVLTPQLYFDTLEFAPLTATETVPTTRVNILDHIGLAKGSKRHLGHLEQEILKWLQEKKKVILFANTPSQLDRIQFLLKEHSLVPSSEGLQIKLGTLSAGFHWPDEKLVVLNESELLGIKKTPRSRTTKQTKEKVTPSDWSGLQALSDLDVGDAVVHIDHGIGRYLGIVRLNLSGAPSDFLQLEYANNDKLYLPVYRLNLIQKYAGSSQTVSLSRLGSQQFQKTKEKVKESVKTLAIDLVQLYAERAIRSGVIFSPRDTVYHEFEASFPFEETPDQLQAIEAVQADLESGKVMDRLVCGDVGYGKTEVAIRAAFRAVNDGKQVAILVPTTLLAQQHEQSFQNRFKDYPILIESFSRFKSPKEQKKILEALQQGKLDIIIGTHRLLSKDVHFQNLGLIIVDEEHRFGVEHKERLKTLKTNTHVLTLTATPIPRTLYMALSGLREISVINTPPIDRLPIRTYLSRYDESLIQRAIEFELSRGGQVFFLHNRVVQIHKVARKLKELVPHAEVIVAHGQMPENELEEAMIAFYQRKANVLVCTAIIESGLDLPSANTLLVERADTLGLSQLYQIRGRVGRGDQRAYCYLLLPEHGNMTSEAKQRLEVIQKFVELGSGFSIASHDLEIRGGGNLLGPQQSGNIAAVGFDLYTELLEEAIREIQGKPSELDERTKEPEIKTPFPAYLSEEFIPDIHHRLSLYRRFSVAKTETEVDQLEAELHDRFGHLPLEAQNLIWMIRLKLLLKQRGIHLLTVGAEKISMQIGETKQVISLVVQSLQELYFSLEKYQGTSSLFF